MKKNRILYLIIGLLCLNEINAFFQTKKMKSPKHRIPDKNPKLFQGDMLFGAKPSAAVLRGDSTAWPSGIVPYEIAPEFSSSTQKIIISTMRKMEKLVAVNNKKCIEFRPKTSSDAIYITIRNHEGCFAYVGRGIGNYERTVSLKDPGCISDGIIMHEFLHVLGFHHEQSRPDRDTYVRILEENIAPGQEDNFKKYNTITVDTQKTAYDYGSVMHYDKLTFSRNNKPTIESVRGAQFGQRDSISATDIQEVRSFYKCSTTNGIIWKGNWAHACDFYENDLKNVRVRGQDCSKTCLSTPECTHYTWTTYMGGTCWMKKTPIWKSKALFTGDQSMVCGLVKRDQKGY